MDRNTLIGLAILGVAAIIGLSFFRKIVVIVLIVIAVAAAAWYYFFR